MAQEDKHPATTKPWQVWVVGGSIHSGHASEGSAKARAVIANQEAEKAGLATRYEVRQRG